MHNTSFCFAVLYTLIIAYIWQIVNTLPLKTDLDIINANKDIDDEDNIIKSNSPLNEVEVDYIQNNLTYDVKFHSTYSEMMRVLMYARDVINNPYLNIVADVKLPKKEASAIIKSKDGFRLARVDTKYSLTIK